MDVQQLRSWIFELYDPLTEDRTYILLGEGAEDVLIDLPPFGRRAVLAIRGTCQPRLVFFTHAGRAGEIEKWRAALADARFAIHKADAAAVPGHVDLPLADGDHLTPEASVINIGAHTPGSSMVLARRAGGVLFAGDAVSGNARGTLSLPDASYAPPERVRAGIDKLRAFEFSAVLSTNGQPVWSAGKDHYLALLEELPRRVLRFGHLVDAPWDRDYLRVRSQMAHNPIVPTDATIAPAAGHGPSTLVPAWERRVPPPVTWEAPAAAAKAEAPPSADGKRWTLAREGARDLPPRPSGRVETLPSGDAEPAVPAFRRLEAAELLDVPHVDYLWRSFDLSPDGEEVVFSWNKMGTFEIYRAPIAGDAIYQLTAGADRSLQPRFSPDGGRIAFLRDHQGDERFDVWLVDREGTSERRLTAGSFTRYSLAWSPDGRSLAYVSDEDGGFAIVRLEVATGKRTVLARDIALVAGGPLAGATVPRWSHDGRFIAYHSRAADGPTDADIFVVPADGSAAPRPIDTRGAPGQAYDPAWGPGDEALALVTDVRGRSEIAIVPLREGRASGAVRYLRDAHFEDDGPVWPDRRTLLYHRVVDATVSVRRAYLVSRDDEPVLDSPGVHFEVRARPDGGLAYTWSGPRDPADVWVKGRDDVAPRRITRSLPAAIDPAVLVTPRHVRYGGADGEPIPALLYVPHREAVADDRPPPAVVYVHGGPTAQHFAWFDVQAQWFANRGYVVLAPNVRGSTGYGRAFREANRGDWGGKDLQDAVKAADWLEAEGVADGARIAVFGGSYGGYLTLMALARAPRRWAAGCSIVGVVSLETLYRTTRGDLRTYLEAELGSPDRDPLLFRERSPLSFADRIATPVLILQGANDPRVPLAEAEQLVAVLRKSGKAFSYHVYPDEGHGFARTENLRDALERALEFFDEHVKAPVGATSPV